MAQEICWKCGADRSAEDNFCRKCGVELSQAEWARSHGLSRIDHRTPVGVFMITFGGLVGALSYFMGIVPMLAFGLASLLIGLMIVYLPESAESYASALAIESSLPSLINTEHFLEDLQLVERGIYIPVSGLGVCPKVFVPMALSQATQRPPLLLNVSRSVFVTVGTNPEDRGVLLDAPGARILSNIERVLSLDLSTIPVTDLGNHLASGLSALGIATESSLSLQNSSIKVSILSASLEDLEAELRNLAPKLVVQIGTPLTSAIAAAVAKATGRYVKLGNAVLEGGRVTFEVSVGLEEARIN